MQEAIEGKLTADWRVANPVCLGDPNTDAVALLAMVKAERQKLIAEGTIKKEKLLPPINHDDMPFALPDGWVFVRLGEVAEELSTGPFGSTLHKYDYIVNGTPVINPTNSVYPSRHPSWIEAMSYIATDKPCWTKPLSARFGFGDLYAGS